MNAKILVSVALVVFMIFIALVFIFSWEERITSSPDLTAGTSTAATSTSERGFTLSEVAVHSTSSDCWVVIDNRVYDLTSFIGLHPGGAEAVIRNCGKDGSVTFSTRGKTPPNPHPETARVTLEKYLIGSLEAE